jgi:hypothetical protein
MATTLERLERLRNYGTRYELVISHQGRTANLCYSGRVSQCAIRRAVQDRGARVAAWLGAGPSEGFKWDRKSRAFVFDCGATVRVGRTQREAIVLGELEPLPQ